MQHIRSTLAAALLVFGGAAVASAQQSTSTQQPQAQSQAQHQHGARKHGQRGARALLRNAQHQLFKGIKLSDAEKANVKNVRAKYAPQFKALREQFKPQLQEARAARQRGDTTALKSLWQKSAGQRDAARKLLEAERNDLRNALTPENRTKFDANVQQFEQRVATRATKWAQKGGKAGRQHGQRGPRA